MRKSAKIVEEDGDEALSEGELDDDAEFLNELEVVSAQASPLRMLRRGNSDPFQTFAIPIDATVSHAMRYP